MTAERDLTELAASIAVRAGELARTRRTEGVQIAATKSVVADIVTHADREVELLIRGLLADARPNDGFLGEESGAEKGTSGVTWVVDPIDGTVNYAYGIPAYAVSIAAVEGEPDGLAARELLVIAVPPLHRLLAHARGRLAGLDPQRPDPRRRQLRPCRATWTRPHRAVAPCLPGVRAIGLHHRRSSYPTRLPACERDRGLAGAHRRATSSSMAG